MTILIENESKQTLPFEANEVIRTVIERTLSAENCPYEATVNVVLTSDEEIRAANLAFRGIDKATDVLSFPAVDYDSPSDFSLVESFPSAYLNPENDELMLGDILVSVDKVYSQAKEYGHSLRRELAFLIAHSMLHLLGYDHIEEAERGIMEEKQEEILTSLGIVRETDENEKI